MKKDYYEILGVPKTSTVEQIKKAYRSLALTHHPDRVAEDKKKAAEEKFKEISEAYGVLSDPQKRQMYDQYGHSGIDQRYTAEDIFRGADFSNFEDIGLGDIFSRIFGEEGLDIFGGAMGGRGSGGTRRARRGHDIQYEVEISLEEAYQGVKKQIKVPRHDICSTCSGNGAKPGSKMKTCQTCKGQGQIVMSSGMFRMAQTCGQCHGQGKVISEPCPQCGGQGLVRVTRNIDVSIPAGVDSDSRLRVKSEGEAGQAGRGDLYIFINVKPHSLFHREGLDLHIEWPVSFVKAALGSEISIPTLSGNVSMKIPVGTQSGRVFRLREKGMPSLRESGVHGDQYVRVMLQVPTQLNAEQKRLLEDYARVSGEDIKGSESISEKIKKVFK